MIFLQDNNYLKEGKQRLLTSFPLSLVLNHPASACGPALSTPVLYLECTLGSPMHADAQTIKVIVPEYALFVLVIGSIGDGVVH